MDFGEVREDSEGVGGVYLMFRIVMLADMGLKGRCLWC